MVSWPDLINGALEMCGAWFILLSVRRLHRDRLVRGVSWVGVCFFAFWGYWNLFYYPQLDQYFSFYGTIGMVIANTTWMCQLIYYTLAERRLTAAAKGDTIQK